MSILLYEETEHLKSLIAVSARTSQHIDRCHGVAAELYDISTAIMCFGQYRNGATLF